MDYTYSVGCILFKRGLLDQKWSSEVVMREKVLREGLTCLRSLGARESFRNVR